MDPTRFDRVEIASEQALWDWVGRHHAHPESVWLVIWKAAHGLQMRKVDGWETLSQPLEPMPLDLAA